MYFGTKSYLKSNYYHTAKHANTALHVQFVSPIITHDVKIRCI
jgi:hypothetical protein